MSIPYILLWGTQPEVVEEETRDLMSWDGRNILIRDSYSTPEQDVTRQVELDVLMSPS